MTAERPPKAESEIVHCYKGWCGQALCLGNETPMLTISTTVKANVTCEKCRELMEPTP